jgi:hypothetical protein
MRFGLALCAVSPLHFSVLLECNRAVLEAALYRGAEVAHDDWGEPTRKLIAADVSRSLAGQRFEGLAAIGSHKPAKGDVRAPAQLGRSVDNRDVFHLSE